MTSLSRDDMKLAEDAAEWVTRLSHDSTSECREELVDWLQQSSRHVEEFLLAQATCAFFRRIDPQRDIDVHELIANAKTSIVPLRQIGTEFEHAVQDVPTDAGVEKLLSAAPTSRVEYRRAWKWLGVAGIVALGVALVVFWRMVNDPDMQTYSTSLGEQRTVRLSDGSLMELNSQSKAAVRFSKGVRKVELLTGEALFVVAHDQGRPFRVSTGETTIQALGTQFDVYRGETTTRVAVVEGRIQLSSEGGSALAPTTSVRAEMPPSDAGVAPATALILLGAGEQASVSRDGTVLKDSKPNVSNAIAWRQRRLVFDHTLLSDVIKELGRYSDFHIELVGYDLSKRHISGVFQADDPQTIVSLLESDPSVSVEHTANGVVIELKN